MKEQVKVLFIVYRTEWWGCLDSLCRQECLNEDILVYVMLIPRYERELGTTAINYSKVHFNPEQMEEELPPEVKVVDYQTFSLEQGFERIYIHNPYDNTYFVDSVDPKYYSWNLKPFAKKLIYVPHLLYIGEIPEEFANSSVYEHVNAIYLADKRAKYSLDVQFNHKVEIVPSGIPEYLERLEALSQGEKQNGKVRISNEARKIPNKASKTFQQDRKDSQRNRMNSQGGEQEPRKKLLCCLSYNDLYYGSEKLIQKLRDVFEYLGGRKDILLIFRPDEDIRARFPWLDEPVRKKYAALVAYFQKNRIGIYDEGADLYRDAVEADGILSFGHPSDRLFCVQGKYVLRLNSEPRPIPSDEVRCIPSLWAMTAVEEDDGIEVWFVPEQTKLICRMVLHEDVVGKGREQKKGKKALKKQIERAQVEIVAEVPDEAVGCLNYIGIMKTGNCLYLMPFDSEGIWKYDLDSDCFSEQYLPGAATACITAAFSYGKYLYLIPRTYSGVIKYHTETEEIEIIDGWIAELESFVLPEYKNWPYFCWAVKQEKNMLYMASSKCDIWMEFDMDSDTWQITSMNLPAKCFIDMVKKGEWVWLFPYGGDEVILWNCITGESQTIYTVAHKESSNVPYEYGIDMGDAIAVFPKYMDNLLLMPAETNIPAFRNEVLKITEITEKIPCREKDYLSEFQHQREIGYQFVKKLKSGQIFAYEYYDGAFLILNEKLQVIYKSYCRIPLEEIKRQQNITWGKVQNENGSTGILNERYFLPAMIDYFVQYSQEEQNQICEYYEKKLIN